MISCDVDVAIWYRNIPSQPSVSQSADCDVDRLVAKIQEHVFVNRVRISELFKDNDPLRSGVITFNRFRQVGIVVM